MSFHNAVDLIDNLLDNGEVPSNTVPVCRVITLGCRACREHVLFGPAPPDTENLVTGELEPGRLFKRHSTGDAPVAIDHPVCLVSSHDVHPLGLLVNTRPGHRKMPDCKTVLLGQGIEDRFGLLAVGNVDVEIGDF